MKVRVTSRMLRAAAAPGTRVKSTSGKWATGDKPKKPRKAVATSVMGEGGWVMRPASTVRKVRAMRPVKRWRPLDPFGRRGMT